MKKNQATRIVERKIKNEKIIENKIQDETTMPMQTKFPSTTHKTPTWIWSYGVAHLNPIHIGVAHLNS